MSRETVSAVLMVKDAENIVRNCLESVRWADEIIVIDGMSTDKTVEICREFTDKIYINEFKGDFGKERQFGADKANCDWILSLDADEVVTEEARKGVYDVLERKNDLKCAAYKIRRKNHFFGHYMKYGGWHGWYLNFFKKGRAYYDGRVHHLLIVDGEIGEIDADILHFPVDDLHEYLDKHNRYTTLEAEELVEKIGVISQKELRRKLVLKPIKVFWKAYVKKKAYKEGFYGIVFSIYFAFHDFLRWAKYWQRVRDKY